MNDKITSSFFDAKVRTYKIFAPHKNVGGYKLGGNPGTVFMLTTKPNWFHRQGVRLVLGWVWEDAA